MMDLEKSKRETLRWYILQALDSARPLGTNEDVLLDIASTMQPDATRLLLRREMGYLDDRGLISVERVQGRWLAKLTRYGVDLVEYNCDCEPGIARPEKYW